MASWALTPAGRRRSDVLGSDLSAPNRMNYGRWMCRTGTFRGGDIITSRLYRTYDATDGIRMLETAIAAVPAARRAHLELLVDHGVTYTAKDFRQACQKAQMTLVCASVAHPHTKGYGKVPRYANLALRMAPYQ